MPLYESTFIARQDLSQSDVTKLMETFGEKVKALGGKLQKKEYWGLRSLAYKINKNRKGHYAHFGVELPATGNAVKNLEHDLMLEDDIMRVLTVKVDTISKEPSAMMKSEDRD